MTLAAIFTIRANSALLAATGLLAVSRRRTVCHWDSVGNGTMPDTLEQDPPARLVSTSLFFLQKGSTRSRHR
jgi:hypothetical protein